MTKVLQGLLGISLIFFTSLSLGTVEAQNEKYRMAVEEAKLQARRALVERLFGIWLVSKSEVRDFELKKDVVITKTMGQLGGVRFSKPAEDRNNGIIMVTARVRSEDVMAALRASGYKGGGNLPLHVEAIGESAFSGPWGSSNTNNPPYGYTQEDFSLANCVAYGLFYQLDLTPPRSSASWRTVTQEIHHNSKIKIRKGSDGRIELGVGLAKEDIEYLLTRLQSEQIISNSDYKRANTTLGILYSGGFEIACSFKGNRSLKTSDKRVVELKPYYDMASILTQKIAQHPSASLAKDVKKYSKLDYRYSSSNGSLKISLTLTRDKILYALASLSKSESEQILSRIGSKGVRLEAEIFPKR